MVKKIVINLLFSTYLFAMSNEEMTKRIEALENELNILKGSQQNLKASQNMLISNQQEQSSALIEEMMSLKDGVFTSNDTYESHSSLGVAASKVYNSSSSVSLGGYGEYKFKKYTNFKNFVSTTANDTRKKSEFNIVRFVPYIGFKFNDWIVMNTEIEFEDGGARSDNTKNYKYAIVEFSYLDFMFDEKYNLRVGHLLVPFGLVNLNHEPTAYLTAERPTVETLIIPSTWHTNGALIYGKLNQFEYYAGVVTSPDAGGLIEGRFLQQGRLGARQFTDDFSMVVRGVYDFENGINAGASFLYGKSSVQDELRPGVSTENSSNADIKITLAEVHMSYEDNGWNIQSLATYGDLGGDLNSLPGSIGDSQVSSSVNGQYLTVGYDLLSSYGTNQQLFAVCEVERLDMDAKNETKFSSNYNFNEYSAGLSYFPDSKVVVKLEYNSRDYSSKAKLADEKVVIATAGFIF